MTTTNPCRRKAALVRPHACLVLAFAAAVCLFAADVDATSPPPCFSQSDLAAVTPAALRVIQPTTAPASDGASSNYLPATDFASGQLSNAQTSSWDLSDQDVKIWANRSDDGPITTKPNPPPGPNVNVTYDGVTAPCFLAFHGRAIAHAATLSEIAYVEGRYWTHNGRGWLDYTRAAGIADDHVLEWSSFVAQAQAICPGGPFVDNDGKKYFYASGYVVEPAARLSTVPTTPTRAIFVDYEPHDGTTVAETNALIYEACQNIHGRSYLCGMWNNPLNGPLQYANGIDATNVDYLAAHVDELGIYPFPKSGDTYLGSFNEQMAMFANPPCAKFDLQADMAMAPSDAAALRAAFTAASCPFGGVWPFYDGQTPGGACSTPYNQVLQDLLGIVK